MTHDAWWWARVVVHNMLVHPLLPFADVAKHYGGRKACAVAGAVYWLHDVTVPDGAG